MSRFPASPDFDHRIADWLEDDPDYAPGAVLGTVLAAFPSIPQRRASRVPWRFPPMSSFAKLAVAVVAVVAVGTVGLIALQPGRAGPAGPAATPSPSPSSSPSPSPLPSPSMAPSLPPPLSETFTSSMHGISISYPAGWGTSAASEPWTTGWPLFREPAGDFLYSPSMTDHLFILLASQPLAGTAGDRWAADTLPPPEECGLTEPVTIDGASGLVGECLAAAVSVEGRGYLVYLHRSPDEPWIAELYDRAWFEQLLDTVELLPQDAVDAVPSPAE